ncbi:MAG: alcohol dehydrogenase catalytic domain-containing protein [Actinomycetota bacterium]
MDAAAEVWAIPRSKADVAQSGPPVRELKTRRNALKRDRRAVAGPPNEEEAVRAFALEEVGGPGSLVDVPVPEPGEGQVRIRVAAAGVNPFDNAVMQGYLKDRMEHRFPLIPGMDASGTVEALGEGVTDWSIGNEVFGYGPHDGPCRIRVRRRRRRRDRCDGRSRELPRAARCHARRPSPRDL